MCTPHMPRELNFIPSWSLFNKRFTRHKIPRLFNEMGNIFDYDTTEKATFDKNGFHVSLDVKDFLPNEISVKTVDNALVIEAKHEEHKDGRGYSSRQFKRRYAIHRGFNMDDINTQLSSDGILTIKVPRELNAIEHGNVRELEIRKTGPVRMGSGKTRNM